MKTDRKTVLITGGNGNLGKLVAARLLEKGQQIIRFDVPGTEPEFSKDDETIITGDIKDTALLNSLLKDYRPNAIYHLASLLSGSSELDRQMAWEINATSSFHLLNLACKFKTEKFFFASTAASYGKVGINPMPLDYAQWPESFYGATKVAVERLGVYFKESHNLDFRCLRFPLVISPDAPVSAVSAFPSQAFKAALAGKSYQFPVSQDTGVSTIFIEDVISSIIDYMAADKTYLTQHVYNLHAFYLSAEMVAQSVLKRFPKFHFEYKPVDNTERLISSWPDVSDDSAARIDWGWAPYYDLEKSADRMCELLQNRTHKT